MRLQEALFLSSQKKAMYERGLPPDNTTHAFRCYRVQVEIREETHQLPGAPEKTRQVYEITVSRKEGETVYFPHMTINTYNMEDCLDELAKWTVGEEFEHPWRPVETWEPKPTTDSINQILYDAKQLLYSFAEISYNEDLRASVLAINKRIDEVLREAENAIE